MGPWVPITTTTGPIGFVGEPFVLLTSSPDPPVRYYTLSTSLAGHTGTKRTTSFTIVFVSASFLTVIFLLLIRSFWFMDLGLFRLSCYYKVRVGVRYFDSMHCHYVVGPSCSPGKDAPLYAYNIPWFPRFCVFERRLEQTVETIDALLRVFAMSATDNIAVLSTCCHPFPDIGRFFSAGSFPWIGPEMGPTGVFAALLKASSRSGSKWV